MSRLKLFKVLAIAVVMTAVTTGAHNIDIRFPVVFELPQSNPVPAPVYFGHSVLMQSSPDGRQAPTFLIGAPNFTESLGLNTGSVFRCQWLQDRKPSCTSLNLTMVRWNLASTSPQLFTGQMNLGWNLAWPGPVHSSNHFLTCAFSWINPLWVDSPPQWWYNPNGQCFYLNAANPAAGAKIIRPMSGRRSPFTPQGEYLHGYGMAGMAAIFSGDGERVYLGAPGYADWRGGFAAVDLTPHMAVQRIQAEIIEEADIVADSGAGHGRDLYLGYSITRGAYFTGQEHVVVGAPRQHLVGSVAFFGRTAERPETPAEPALVLNGNQTGEYYGYSLLTMDINQDGADDLLVGAPMYSSYKEDSYDEGRVFVYLSDGAMVMKAASTLLGGSKPSARFGTAMVDLGDLNLDKFPEAAIGAPYEDEWRGSVYVYRGSANGFPARYAQRIAAASPPLASLDLRGFGYSFSAGVDIDRNRFNDLLVGSYLSDKAVLLRTRPIIRIRPSILLSDDRVNLQEPCRWPDEDLEVAVPTYRPACVQLRFCFTVTSPFDVNWPGGLVLSASLRLDLDTGKRAFVVQNVANQPGPSDRRRQFVLSQLLTQDFLLVPPNTQYCSDHTLVYFREQKQIENLIDPVLIELDYGIETVDSSESVFAVPVLDTEHTNISTELHFRMCADTAKECVSELHLEPVFLFDGQPPTGHRFAASSTNELVQGQYRSVTLLVHVTNRAEPAFRPELRIEVDRQVTLVQLDPKCQAPKPIGDRTVFVCQLEEPLWNGLAQNPVNLTFAAFNATTDILFDMSLEVANRVDPRSTTKYEVTFRPVKRAGIQLRIQPDQSWKYATNESRRNLEATFQLDHHGPSSIQRAQLRFIYPWNVRLRQLISSVQIVPTGPGSVSRPFKCSQPGPPVSDSGDDSLLDRQAPEPPAGDNEVVVLACGHHQTPKELACAQVRCQLGPLEPGIIFGKLTALIDVHQVHQLFPRFANLTLVVEVHAEMLDEGLPEVVAARGQMRFHLIPVYVPQTNYFPWILLAIILALLLLAAIIFCCYRFGFFKRNRPSLSDQ